MGTTERIKILLFNPKLAWDQISQEKIPILQVILSFFIPLILIPVVATFISYGIIGYRVPYFGLIHSYELGFRMAISMFASALAGTFISASFLFLLAPFFGSEKNFNKTLQLVIYSYTPFLIGGVFYVYYATSPLGLIIGLYGFYLLFLGLVPMLKIDEDKNTSFFIICLLVTISSYSIITFCFDEIGMLTHNLSCFL